MDAQAASTAQAGAVGDGQDVAAAGRRLRADGLCDEERPGDGRMASDGTAFCLHRKSRAGAVRLAHGKRGRAVCIFISKRRDRAVRMPELFDGIFQTL